MTRQARVWKRLAAFALDLYLCIMLFASFMLIIEQSVPSSLSEAVDASLSPQAIVALLYASIFVLLYHVFSEYIVGQTPGMLIFGLSVEVKDTKKSIRFWQALVRNIFIVPVFPFNLLWVIEPIFYVFQGRRLVDYWSKTETVE